MGFPRGIYPESHKSQLLPVIPFSCPKGFGSLDVGGLRVGILVTMYSRIVDRLILGKPDGSIWFEEVDIVLEMKCRAKGGGKVRFAVSCFGMRLVSWTYAV